MSPVRSRGRDISQNHGMQKVSFIGDVERAKWECEAHSHFRAEEPTKVNTAQLAARQSEQREHRQYLGALPRGTFISLNPNQQGGMTATCF